MTATIPPANDRLEVARWFDACLRERVLPYWCRTADPVHGGYRLSDRHDHLAARRWRWLRQPSSPTSPPQKYLVTQSRMLYGLSLAHRLGLGGAGGDCLRAAELGYRFLSEVMLDRDCGGLVAITKEDGTVVDDRKLLCQHSFAIYGLVEYHRAGGGEAPLALALEVYRTLHAHLHDQTYGGWIEHADRAFRPIRQTLPPPRGVVGIPELKSQDNLLHWMEALSELYQATGDRDVGASLAESLRLNLEYLFPAGETVAHRYRTRDWRLLGGSRFDKQSYGHNVEFAWLMWRAQEVLGWPCDVARFDALMDHTLRCGCDLKRGGIFYSGRGHRAATDRRKAWWVQAEMLAALCDRLRRFGPAGPEQEAALEGLLEWILHHQILPEDGIWIAVLDEDGRVLDPEKAGPWKAAYHDLRAMTKCIEAFS
jgi:mannose/cellobiose epimerase-like protein (N-acyl-D-glucosamine 2-epimerase family)